MGLNSGPHSKITISSDKNTIRILQVSYVQVGTKGYVIGGGEYDL